jgi:hypothetical protein
MSFIIKMFYSFSLTHNIVRTILQFFSIEFGQNLGHYFFSIIFNYIMIEEEILNFQPQKCINFNSEL